MALSASDGGAAVAEQLALLEADVYKRPWLRYLSCTKSLHVLTFSSRQLAVELNQGMLFITLIAGLGLYIAGLYIGVRVRED